MLIWFVYIFVQFHRMWSWAWAVPSRPIPSTRAATSISNAGCNANQCWFVIHIFVQFHRMLSWAWAGPSRPTPSTRAATSISTAKWGPIRPPPPSSGSSTWVFDLTPLPWMFIPQSTYFYQRWNRVSVSAQSAGAYTATLLVMVNVMKGGGRAPPPPLPAWANFTHMMECTPESSYCYSVYSVVYTTRREDRERRGGTQNAFQPTPPPPPRPWRRVMGEWWTW